MNGEVGSTATTATFLFFSVSSLSIELSRVLLPAPGGPVIPITGTGLKVKSFNKPSALAVLFSTHEIALASDFLSPVLIGFINDSGLTVAIFCG